MKLSVLGPLLVEDDGREIRLDGPRQAKVLARLLLKPNSVVAMAGLVEAMWDGDAPATAVRQIQDAVSGLRRNLRGSNAERRVIDTVGNGYRINLGTDELDLLAFDAHLERARELQAAADAPGCVKTLRNALACWRGPALDGLASRALATAAEQLNARRVSAYRQLMAIELSLHHHLEIVEELLALVRVHPFDEGLAQQAMLALYRCGRRADALALFHDLRTLLIDELGLEPSTTTRRLHEQILREDPEIAISATGEQDPASPDPVARKIAPMQLPPDTRTFTGRRLEAARLVELARAAASTGVRQNAVVISAIDGMAGIGKTALAIRTGHQVRRLFPDGQLFIDLRGFTPESDPVTASNALGSLLHSLGVPLKSIPSGLDARAALYRDRLAGTRTLIVLDNAAGAAQVRPLLPGDGGCLVLVTSRRRLTGLNDVHNVTLGTLSEQEALELLRKEAGPERIPDGEAADAEAAAELVALCGYLPLAIRITAARLRLHRALSLEDVLEGLRSGHLRLANLADEDRGMTAALEASYAALTKREQRLFRYLSLIPGPDFDVHAAANLAGSTEYRETERLVESLLDHSLLVEHGAGRYRFHDLVRLFASERAAAQEPAADRRTAHERLLVWYAATVDAAGLTVYPGRPPLPLPAAADQSMPMSFDDADDCHAWYERELANLNAAVASARASGLFAYGWMLPHAMWPFLIMRGDLMHWLSLTEIGGQCADEADDRFGRARMLGSKATALSELGRFSEAAAAYESALSVIRSTQPRNPESEAGALNNLAAAYMRLEDYERSVSLAREALELQRSVAGTLGMSATGTLNNLARFLLCGDRADEAMIFAEQAVALNREVGTKVSLGLSLHTYAETLWRRGETEAAREPFEQALTVQREIGDKRNEIGTLDSFTRFLIEIGHASEAVGLLRDCHRLMLELHDPRADATEARLRKAEAAER
jgi:DNA-binding SARP family transcriptional activator